MKMMMLMLVMTLPMSLYDETDDIRITRRSVMLVIVIILMWMPDDAR